MKNLKFYTVAAALATAGLANAQVYNDMADSDSIKNKLIGTKIVVSEYDEEGNRTPLHMNGFWDNWFIGAGIGSTTFIGNYTSGMPLKDRMSFVGNIHIGKWFTPTAGLRLNGYIYRPKGFDVNPNSPIVTEPAKDGMYHTKWTMATVTAEMIVNATNLFFGYRNDRLYNCIPFIGAGWARNVSTHRPNDVVFSAGVLNRFYLTDAWALNIELRANLFDEEMDKTAGGGCKNDMLATLMVGASYRFKNKGNRGWRTCTINNDEVRKVQNMLYDLEAENMNLKEELDRKKNALNNNARVEIDMQVSDKGIFFEKNSSKLSERSRVNIGFYAQMMKQAADKEFIVTGYADAKFEKNSDKLSKDRAEAVAEALVNEFGISKDRIQVEWKGGVEEDLFYNSNNLNRVVMIEMKK